MAGSDNRLPRFNRAFFGSGNRLSRIGDGEIGGKAQGLRAAEDILGKIEGETFPASIVVGVPRTAVLTTEVFDLFLERNELDPADLTNLRDERIVHAFLQADFPTEFLGDLRALVDETHQPLAVRSSSLLEDALNHPFAGVYGTKMVPNNQPDPGERFRKLIEAIKFVYATTFFQAARDYGRTLAGGGESEKMAVVLQEVVGTRQDQRFYPHLSGVCKSYNYYPSANQHPKDGIVSLALGLGKSIVDGGVCWSYSPARPKAPPPFASVADRMKNSQVKFWAVNMGKAPAYDPVAETEYLVQPGIAEADYDGTLRYLASTYDARSDRLSPGTGFPGPRVLDFAPLLQLIELPLNTVLQKLMKTFETEMSAPVEIEFAVTIEVTAKPQARLGFLQVRPMAVADQVVEISEHEMAGPEVLASSETVMGNGSEKSILDVVYISPDRFDRAESRKIAAEIETLNRSLIAGGRQYLLIGFGRWGSSDPWLGIPVEWGQISGARGIVEATLEGFSVEPSQGSHFFHNLSSFGVTYFMIHHAAQPGIDWTWLDSQQVVTETAHVRHVRLPDPLVVRVDGRSARGLILKR